MRRMFLSTLLKGLVTLSASASLVACGGGGDDDTPAPSSPTASGQPWTVQPLMGNFTINSGNVTTNQDGVSTDYLTDYVMQSALPNVNFEYLTLNAYLPVTDALSIDISSVNVQMHNVAGQSTGNIYYGSGSQFLQRMTINGRTYSVFRLAGFYNGASRGSITPTNFANIVFTMTIRYTDANGTLVGSRTTNLEVYKR
jgi:hypothetical protein